ncbi:class I SAM-dependent methyltransferase [Pseudahrensia aquimaris]|uniref:Class I SAM-dependent methyltransferase n=1 Tax=Pseudahrensia aquimaris TaxID=744461 RepID=A0ABW3FG40_9HYPH
MTVVEQYVTDKNLKSRANLHARYGTKNWFEFVHAAMEWQENEHVADIGCGPGWLWSEVSSPLSILDGLTLVDTSQFLLQQAQTTVSALVKDFEPQALEASVCDLPLNDDGFDTVLALHMLYHVEDQPRAVMEFKRVCAEGGRVAISTNSLDNLARINQLGFDVFGAQKQDLGAVLFSPSRARELLEEHFESVAVHRFEDNYEISDAKDIAANLLSFPLGDAADSVRRKELAEALERELISVERPFVDTKVSFLLIAN